MTTTTVFGQALQHAPLWAAALLVVGLLLHITGGTIGILSGYAAVAVKKGGDWHRAAGMAFVLGMLVMASAAVLLAVPLVEPSNVMGGMLAGYMVVTGWLTMQRPAGPIGAAERIGFAFIATVAIGTLVLTWIAWEGPKHAAFGYAWVFYAVFAVINGAIALTDLRVILRGRLSANERLRRHLWRMCFGFFFAAASFFIGQQKVMPAWLHGSPVLWLLGLAPLGVMAYWLVRTRQRKARAKLPAGVPA
jgi:hypothetical protein